MKTPAAVAEPAPAAGERRFLPYGRHQIDDDDVRAVEEVLRSDWLTTGPKVEEFERAFAEVAGAAHAVAVSSGTAALHAAVAALAVGPGDEVVVPALSFVATANCALFEGARPVFADVDPETLLLDPASVEARLSERTRAIVAVDYAGQPCDYDALSELAERGGLALVADACHAPGGRYRGRPVGSLATLTTFSFHPVKHLTTGEGGMITTDDGRLARRMRRFRNHGLDSDHRQRAERGTWVYEMTELGYNYRLSDFQSALGLSQLGKLEGWLSRRRQLARLYDAAFSERPAIEPLAVRDEVEHAYHLYVVRLRGEPLRGRRGDVFQSLRKAGIGVNVHYLPIHLQPYYRRRLGTGPGLCPAAEAAYEDLLTLPLHPAMSDADVDAVVAALDGAVSRLGDARR